MSVKKILIVCPKTPDTFWKFRGVYRYLGVKSAHANLTLITLAALIPSGWLVRLCDMNTDELTPTDLAWSDVVMVTGMTVHRHGIEQIVAQCKAMDKIVVVGGPFASALPDAPELMNASAVFIGEAIDKQAFGRLLHDLDCGTLEQRYQALPSPPISDSPIPRFDLLDFGKFADVTMQVACGCPFRCEFCEVWKLFGAPRSKDPSKVVSELQTLFDTGYRGSIFIVDDNYIGNKKVAMAITKAILAWQTEHGFPFAFYTQTDIRLAEEEALGRLMAEANFYAVFVGLESSSETVLAGMGKTQNIGIDAAVAAKKIRGFGMLVYCGLIIGNDDDDKSSFDEMREFVGKVGASRSMLGICVATPGTDLYDRLLGEGRILPEVTGDQFEITNILPRHMTLSELVSGHRRVLESVYDPVVYFERARRELHEWKSIRPQSVKMRDYRAAALSILNQGLLSSYRLEYWKFLHSVFKDDPRKIGRAFAAAVVFSHLDGYTKTLRQQLGTVLERILKLEDGGKVQSPVVG